MIRAEYKYQKFKYYLGLADSPIAENDDISDSVTDDNEEEKQQWKRYFRFFAPI